MPRPLIIDQITERFHVHAVAKLRTEGGEEYYECLAVVPDDDTLDDHEEVAHKILGIKAMLTKIGVFASEWTTVRCFHPALKWVMSARSAHQEVAA
jgi:hypothetical protein